MLTANSTVYIDLKLTWLSPGYVDSRAKSGS